MMRELARLYAVFFRIGLCSIGGGYVMLAMLRAELVDKYRWLTDAEILDYYAIGQATPGIIAINTATFVGYKRRRVLGALAATIGMVTPSLIIITLIAMFFTQFQAHPLVQRAFHGMRAAVAMLLLFTVYHLIISTVKNRMGVILACAAFGAVAFGGLSPIPVILIAALVGLLTGAGRKGAAR